uniref:DUF7788 domain-containing protein n=1 Tax=viral metagenome TaxID=1070528 RepID=A0A6C0LMB3_9ZZZZ
MSSSSISLSIPLPAVGVKGSDVFSSSGDPRVDLNVKCVRGADASVLRAALDGVLSLKTQEALEDAFVLAFHSRNIRGGKGEKAVFQSLYGRLCETQGVVAQALLDLIPHYGCWNDLLVLAEGTQKDISKTIVDLYAKTLYEESKMEKPNTLAAKWAPREGSKHKELAKQIAWTLFPPQLVSTHGGRMNHYRRLVADMNAKLNTVETLMCSDRWDMIVPASVPGRAGKLYSKAFLNLPSTHKVKGEEPKGEFRHPDSAKRMECRRKFEEHFAKAAKGEAKVHGADTLFPHEVVQKASEDHGLSAAEKDQLNAVWLSMVEKAKSNGGLGKSIFMSDFSGSMSGTPYWVSMALGILGSQVCSDEFKDKLMTFDSDPTWHHFEPGSDLFARIKTIEESGIGQGLSTDFQKAMDLVLATLKTERMRPGQEPENLIVLTDMGWDQACSSSEMSDYTGHSYRHAVKTAGWQTHVEMIQEAFKRAGEDMWGPGQGFTAPRIVIWNLRASPQTDFHATADTPGVAMLSGWSPTQFEILMKEGPRQMTAYEMLRLEMDDPKYLRVRERIRAVIGSL